MSKARIKVLAKRGSYFNNKMIEEYNFGSININGKTYTQDVQAKWSGEVLSWQREESHSVAIKDIERVFEESPDLIVIGTGEIGAVNISDKVRERILSEGIGLIIEKTGKAIKSFNEAVSQKRKVIGLFHLTC